MINFFRKNRHRLADNNHPASPAGRFLKYSRYAIGEIVLVMIGILLAFQVNTWKTNREQRTIEKEYMQSLLTDLKKDKSILDGKLEFGPIPIIYNDSLFEELQKSTLQGKEKRIYHFLLLFTNSIDISYHDRTISQLKNSGGFQFVRNKQVSDAIVDYDIYMRESIKNVESNMSSNLINNDIMINYNFYEIYKVQHLQDSAIIYKNDISKVNYPDDLKLLSYDDDKIKLVLNSMSYVREIDEYNYERAIHALSLNRQLDSLIRKEYLIE